MKRTLNLALTIILFWGITGYAQTYDYSSEPGFVDFGNLEQFENSEESTEVLINQNLLHMVAKMGKHMDINGKKDSSFANMVGGLKLIKVNTFGIDSTKIKSVFKLISKIDKELIHKGWNRLVKQKEKDSRTNVYIRTDNNSKIQGLVVTQAEKDEATFVNIVGTIDLEKLGELSSNFDIPDIDSVMNGKSQKRKREIEINVDIKTDSTNTK
jgi:hypothetical protein